MATISHSQSLLQTLDIYGPKLWSENPNFLALENGGKWPTYPRSHSHLQVEPLDLDEWSQGQSMLFFLGSVKPHAILCVVQIQTIWCLSLQWVLPLILLGPKKVQLSVFFDDVLWTRWDDHYGHIAIFIHIIYVIFAVDPMFKKVSKANSGWCAYLLVKKPLSANLAMNGRIIF